MDGREIRPAAREIVERRGEGKPQQRDRDTEAPKLNTHYRGRHERDGSMWSENYVANNYNDRVNEKWFAHQRSNGKDRQARAQAVEGGGRRTEQRAAPATERELNGGGASNRRNDLEKGREPQPARSPSRGMPEKGEVRVELPHGFNADFSVSDPRNQIRIPAPQDSGAALRSGKQEINRQDVTAPAREQGRLSLDERLARPDHPRTQEMRASSRELLQRLDERPQHPVPERPQPRELNRPRGLER